MSVQNKTSVGIMNGANQWKYVCFINSRTHYETRNGNYSSYMFLCRKELPSRLVGEDEHVPGERYP